MGKIRFVTHDGTTHEAELVPGRTLMQHATDNRIPGIDGDCGGVCACGTCHVILNPQWQALIGDSAPDEDIMLSLSAERQASSRLACQITVQPEMDGFSVQLPEFQM